MKNAPKLFIIVLFLLMQTGLAFALDPPVPPGGDCCVEFEDDVAAYNQCLMDPESYCSAPLPANNSIDILMYVGLLFGTFVIFKKINHKKTPM